MSQIDIAIVAAYFLVIITVGLRFARRQKTTEQYFVAGRALPGWVVSFSLVGSMIGSTTFIGHPGNVFNSDMWYLPFFLTLPVIMLFVSRWIVTVYRHRIRMSVYEYLEHRFGYPARVYGSAAFIVSRIVDVSSTLYFLGIAVAFLTGVDVWWVILIVGFLTAAYTVIGGITAVAWSDVLQSTLLVGGGVLCLGVALLRPDGGPAAVLQKAWAGGRFGWGQWEFDWTEKNVWILIAAGGVWGLQRYAAEQHMVQRYLLARTDREASRAAYVGAVACLPIWILFMVLGACIWSFYQLSGTNPPPEVLAVKDNIVPYFIRTQCPTGLLGLIVAALAAGAMGCLAADLNSLATVVVDDYYKRLRASSSDREKLWVGRVAVGCLGLAAILLAQQWIGVGSAIEFGTQLLSVATAGLLGLFALGLLTTRGTPRGAWMGILAGALFSAWATLTSVKFPAMQRPLLNLGTLNYTLNPFLIGVFSHIILLAVGYGASLVLPRTQPTSVHLTVWAPKPRG
jgi:SSS family solute:Na+ symporter